MRNNSNLGRSEAGQVLVYVTIMLILAGLVIPPLLGFTFGAGSSAQIRQDRMLHVYAADAGIEDAFYNIVNSAAGLPQSPDDDPLLWGIEDVNGYDVGIEICKEPEEGVYRITSTATSDGGVSTTIESYVSLWDPDWSGLLEGAITSNGNLTIQPNANIVGDVYYNDDDPVLKGDIDGNVTYEAQAEWPTAEELSRIYLGGLWSSPYDSFPDGYEIDISSGTEADPYPIGPLYAAGDLTITGGGVARLDGTVYVADNPDDPYDTGDLVIKPGTEIDLNGHTIYVEGSIDIQPVSTITGSGAIIAVGDVDFQPNIEASPDDFLLVMSVEGTVSMQPSGSLYGCVVGAVEIQLQPGCTLTFCEPSEDGLDFPTGGNPFLEVINYTIA